MLHPRIITPFLAWALLALAGTGAPGATPPAPPRAVEIRLARSAPAPGYAEAPTRGLKEKVFVAEKALFSDGDFAGARVASMGDGAGLLLSFTPGAAKRLAAFTRKSRGKKIALLLEGHVLLVTQIGEPILDGEMALVSNLAYSDAKAVCEALRKAAPK
jgi:preprotein translocase subunit SecD